MPAAGKGEPAEGQSAGACWEICHRKGKGEMKEIQTHKNYVHCMYNTRATAFCICNTDCLGGVGRRVLQGMKLFF